MLSNLNNIIEKHNSIEVQMFVQGKDSVLRSMENREARGICDSVDNIGWFE
jgi:hypothetical protein